MKKHIATLILVAVASGHVTAARADEVTDWNQIMLDAITAAGTGISPIVATRAAAIVQASVYDAVNGIERRYTPIHVEPAAAPGASVRAAAVRAAYVNLSRLFPAQQSALDAKLTASLSAIASDEAVAHSQSVDRGIEWGQTVADEIWAWRSTDGFVPAPPPFLGGVAPGEWRPTPPAFAPGAVPQFANLVPWVIQSPSQFLPPGPPMLVSAQYAADVNEVELVGSATSATRTADQTTSALFWQSSSSPDFFWDRVAGRDTARHDVAREPELNPDAVTGPCSRGRANRARRFDKSSHTDDVARHHVHLTHPSDGVTPGAFHADDCSPSASCGRNWWQSGNGRSGCASKCRSRCTSKAALFGRRRTWLQPRLKGASCPTKHRKREFEGDPRLRTPACSRRSSRLVQILL